MYEKSVLFTDMDNKLIKNVQSDILTSVLPTTYKWTMFPSLTTF